jgi:hypothetical protein
VATSNGRIVVSVLLLVSDLLIGNADPDVLGEDLLVDVLDFEAGGVSLKDAVLQLTEEAGFSGRT